MNYAGALCFRDIVSGTGYMPNEKRTRIYGISGDIPKNYPGLLLQPFRGAEPDQARLTEEPSSGLGPRGLDKNAVWSTETSHVRDGTGTVGKLFRLDAQTL